MKFELYTAKTVKQCVSELTERTSDKEAKIRPPIQAWFGEDGTFSLVYASKVLIMTRKTRLQGELVRDNAVTIVRGYVSEGVPPQQIGFIVGALGLVSLAMLINGQAVFSILVVLVSLVAYMVLVGDYHNSTYLLKELKRVLSAKEKLSAVASSAPVKPVSPTTKPTATTKSPPKSTASKTTASTTSTKASTATASKPATKAPTRTK